MRHGRAKASRRTLQFYRINAPHLKSPYKILLDGTFLVASVRNKVSCVLFTLELLLIVRFDLYLWDVVSVGAFIRKICQNIAR